MCRDNLEKAMRENKDHVEFYKKSHATAVREAARVEEAVQRGNLDTLLRSIATSSVLNSSKDIDKDILRLHSSLDFQFRQIAAACKARRAELARARDECAREAQVQRDAVVAAAVEQQRIRNEIQREWHQWLQKQSGYALNTIVLMIAVGVMFKLGITSPFADPDAPSSSG
jgi:hypothetical protein